MKLNNHPFRTAALLLLVLLAAACTKEDDFAALPDEGTANTAPLTITVTDGAYAPAQSPDDDNTPDTRAVERGYATEFTAGDQIGLYVVGKENASNPAGGKRTFLHENLCLTHDGTGWTLPAGTKLTYQPPEGGEILYFAYYPYRSNMTNKVDIDARDTEGNVTTEARWFFYPLIYNWSPAADQSTYKAYTASDLMVARGEVAKRTDGTDGSVLSFTMEHQMALAVIRVPTTVYTYSETIDGKSKDKSYRLYCGLTIKGWMADDNTYRYLADPSRDVIISGSYYNASLEKRDFKGNTSPNESGKYFLYTVDKGEETETRRALQEGDFYMRDGGVIPKEMINGKMPADVQKDCLGVVFWVGENKKNHWTQTGEEKRGDRLLMRDHPGCVHGMVVALHDASAGAAWATGSGESEQLYEWAKAFDGFNSEEQADWLAIKDSYVLTYGYCTSHLMKLYRTHHPGATFPAYNTISEYAARHPVPGSSSGWFLPAQGELVMMCYGMLTDYSQSRPTTQRDLLNDLFTKAGGDVLRGTYWSTNNFEQTAWYLNFDDQTNFGYDDKSTPNKVRAVLAF